MNDAIILDDLTPAMMTMETDVELPSGIRANSITGNLIGLKPGEVYVYAQEMDSSKALVDLQTEATALRYKMRNGVSSSLMMAPAPRKTTKFNPVGRGTSFLPYHPFHPETPHDPF